MPISAWVVAAVLLAFAVLVFRRWREIRKAVAAAQGWVPPPSGRSVVQASAMASLAASRVVLDSPGERRRVDVHWRVLAAGRPVELRATETGLVVVDADRSFELGHASLLELVLVPEAGGVAASRTAPLLSVLVDVPGALLELVFRIDGTRVTAERLRREVHVRGTRVQEGMAALLARRGLGP